MRLSRVLLRSSFPSNHSSDLGPYSINCARAWRIMFSMQLSIMQRALAWYQKHCPHASALFIYSGGIEFWSPGVDEFFEGIF